MMKILFWFLISMTLCFSAFTGCNDAEDAGESDTDTNVDTGTNTDTDTDIDTDDCDPGNSWVLDPYAETQEAGESGFDHLFYPPDPICLPENVSYYKYDMGRILDFTDWVWEIAEAHMDWDCVTNCEDMEDYVLCKEADCTASDGTVIEYRKTVYQQPEYSYYDDSIETITETLTIEPPVGKETWSRMFVDRLTVNTDENGGADMGSYRFNSFDVQWYGTIHQALPSDYTTSGSCRYTYSGYNNFPTATTSKGTNEPLKKDEKLQNRNSNHSQGSPKSPDLGTCHFENDSLTLRIEKDWSSIWRVVLNDVLVELVRDEYDSEIFYGYIDDVCIGAVDRDSWVIIGDCPEV